MKASAWFPVSVILIGLIWFGCDTVDTKLSNNQNHISIAISSDTVFVFDSEDTTVFFIGQDTSINSIDDPSKFNEMSNLYFFDKRINCQWWSSKYGFGGVLRITVLPQDTATNNHYILDAITTPKGITIGDDSSDVKSAYGSIMSEGMYDLPTNIHFIYDSLYKVVGFHCQ